MANLYIKLNIFSSSYSPFIIFLGFFGILIFIGYGVMSKRFRHGFCGEKAAMAAKYKVKKPAASLSSSRPSTSVSIVQVFQFL